MNSTRYAENFFLPKLRIEDVGKIVKRPKPSLLYRVGTFFSEWTQHSYEAWIKAGRPDNF